MNLEKDTTSHGVLSAVCGAVAMIAWLVPVFGAVMGLVALYAGTIAMDNHQDGWPLAGISLGVTSLALTFLRSGLVYYYG